MEDSYFFDTYAIVEVLKGSPQYSIFKQSRITVTVFNLAELHYKIRRDFDKETADQVLADYLPFVIAVSETIIRAASEFKLIHRRRDLSLADAIGYVAALQLGIKFLTGDKQFEDFPGVEFVK